jgi:hypothetical protein
MKDCQGKEGELSSPNDVASSRQPAVQSFKLCQLRWCSECAVHEYSLASPASETRSEKPMVADHNLRVRCTISKWVEEWVEAAMDLLVYAKLDFEIFVNLLRLMMTGVPTAAR